MDYDVTASGRMRGKGVEFDRIRRITGYLAGTLNRFNPAKRAEESQRTKNDISNLSMLKAVTDDMRVSAKVEDNQIAC